MDRPVPASPSEEPSEVAESPPTGGPPPHTTVGWRKLVEFLRRRRALWGPFAERSPQEILAWQNVAGEIDALKKMGVTNAWELVLREGPRRCRQVRRRVERRGTEVRDPAALVVTLVLGQHRLEEPE